LSNYAIYTNAPDLDGEESGTVYFYNYWIATSSWDIIVNFDWNVSDVLDPLTGATRYLALNPVFEGYGTVEGSFAFHFNEDWWVKITGYVDPGRADFLNSKFWYPVKNWPNWWESQEEEESETKSSGVCMGASIHNFPVKGQVWLDFGYPTCAWSIFDFLAWVDTAANSGVWTW